MWHRIDQITRTPSGEISAECHISVESQWFLGHFPGKPILPAIAQLAMVRETISRGSHQAGDVNHDNNRDGHHDSRPADCRFSRVKFKKMITPGECLIILASPKKTPGTYTFRITVEKSIVCSGNLTIKTDS